MNTPYLLRDRNFITRFMDQPTVMPKAVRAQLESAWNNQPVQLYALIDLDATFQLSQSWLALGPEQIAVAHEKDNGTQFEFKTIAHSQIKEIREAPGLSCTIVSFYGAPDKPALAVIRYTQRQRQAMGPIIFLLKEKIKGNTLGESNVDADSVYAKAVAKPISNAQASVAENKVAVLWRLLAYIKPYRGRFILGLLSAAGLTAVSLVPPFFTGYLVDDVIIPYTDGAVPLEEASRTGWMILGVIVTVYLLRQVFMWLQLRMMSMIGEWVARDLRDILYNHLHKLSLSYFSHRQTGSIVSRVSSDTDRLWDFIAFGFAEMTLSTLMIIGLGTVLFMMDWQLSLVVIGPVPLVLYFIYIMGRNLHRTFLRVWRKWSDMTGLLADTLSGVSVVKAFNQEEYERNRFGQSNASVTNEGIRIQKVWTTYWPLIYLGLESLVLLVWFFALPRLLGDGTPDSITLTPGEFIAFLLYVGMFIMPVENFGYLTRLINRSLSSAHRIFELLDTEPEIVSRPNPVRLDPVEGNIQFDDVSFGYDPVLHMLKNISFEINPGEMIGLVGKSGAGKTTITNLIARFYDAQAGSVTVDGVDIRDLDIGHYREQIGMVMQDPFLFHGSILDNIRYGNQEATLEQVVTAANAANAHDFISKLKLGYDTIVGERGHTLSGGERQRVSIARAILHNPRILILDEATSSVDSETERNIQEALERLIEGRTVIAIAHRLSTLRKANRLFVMHEGSLVESGTHDELLQKENGVYKNLYNLQRELHEMYVL